MAPDMNHLCCNTIEDIGAGLRQVAEATEWQAQAQSCRQQEGPAPLSGHCAGAQAVPMAGPCPQLPALM